MCKMEECTHLCDSQTLLHPPKTPLVRSLFMLVSLIFRVFFSLSLWICHLWITFCPTACHFRWFATGRIAWTHRIGIVKLVILILKQQLNIIHSVCSIRIRKSFRIVCLVRDPIMHWTSQFIFHEMNWILYVIGQHETLNFICMHQMNYLNRHTTSIYQLANEFQYRSHQTPSLHRMICEAASAHGDAIAILIMNANWSSLRFTHNDTVNSNACPILPEPDAVALNSPCQVSKRKISFFRKNNWSRPPISAGGYWVPRLISPQSR